MLILEDAYKSKCLKKLEGLWHVFAGLNTLYCCTIPSETFEISDGYFDFLNIEVRKLLVGKLYVLLADNFKKPEYNTISFKLLIKKILDHTKDQDTEERKSLLQYRNKINKIDKKYKNFRNKNYAHIELNDDDTLKRIEGFNVSNKDITELLELGSNPIKVRIYQ